MEAERKTIPQLHRAGLTPKEILDQVSVKKTTIYKVIKSGKWKSGARVAPVNKIRNSRFIGKVKKRVERDPTSSMRRIAKELNVDEKTIRTTIKDLGKKSLVRPPRQLITENTRVKRLERARAMLNKMKKGGSPVTIFSDKKIFTVDQAYNRRNDRVILDQGETPTPVNRTKHPASVMVLGVVASNGKKCPPIFIESGVRITADIYIDLLKTKVLPWIKRELKGVEYVFQQDGAPAHTAKKTQDFLRANFGSFWGKEIWPPSSPDLNPLDFSIWGVLEAKACRTSHKNVEDLKKSVKSAWRSLSTQYIQNTCKSLRSRLEKVVNNNGGLIE